MQHQSSATIFLADGYQIFQTEDWRSISVLREHTAFHHLTAMQDETLAGEKTAVYQSTGYIILVPVVGNIIAETNGAATEIACGELIVIHAGTPFKVLNPYKEHLVNFLLLYLDSSVLPNGSIGRYAFDLDDNKNELVDVFNKDEVKLSLGKFDMRRETTYYSDQYHRSSFCFVVQGSFEIEGRLLHERDALSIWNTHALDIESLGKESILLLLELPV